MMPPAKLLIDRLAVHAAHRGAGEVADGLDGSDDVDDRDACDGRRHELDLEGHDGRQLEPAGRSDIGEVDHTEAEGDGVADEHAEEKRAELRHAFREVAEIDAGNERDDCNDPVLGAAEVRRALAACHVADSNGIERKADAEDDRAGDNGREELPDLLQEDAKDDGHKAADELGADDGTDAEASADRGERRHIGKESAHDDGEARADLAIEERVCLNKRDEACHHQGDLDEHRLLISREAAGICDDDGRRDDADNGSHDMLQGKRQELSYRRLSLSLEQYGIFRAFGHTPPSPSVQPVSEYQIADVIDLQTVCCVVLLFISNLSLSAFVKRNQRMSADGAREA